MLGVSGSGFTVLGYGPRQMEKKWKMACKRNWDSTEFQRVSLNDSTCRDLGCEVFGDAEIRLFHRSCRD